MKGKIVERIAKAHLLPRLPGWEVRGKLLYLREPADILRGVCVDSSAFSANAVYVEIFAMPLYIPTDHLYFSYGNRLTDSNNWKQWSVDPEYPVEFVRDLLNALEPDGMGFLDQFRTPELFVDYLDRTPGLNDFSRLKTKAYSLAYLGRDREADGLLVSLIAEANAAVKESPWAKNIAEHAQLLRTTIGQGPEAVRSTMADWVKESRTKLKLPA
jgi:hypothetical protein